MRTFDKGFVPPHCPNPDCRHHADPEGWRYGPFGWFERKAKPRRIRRFRCRTCRRTFSTQTFDPTYYLKRPELQAPLFEGLVACSGFRQLGRSLKASGVTMQRQSERLGRHSLLYLQSRGPRAPVTEPLVVDGLHSFEYSQYWPFELNVAVGGESGYTYAFTESELRRSGSMRPDQKRRRDELEARHGRPDPGATRKAIVALMKLACPKAQDLRVLTDEHQDYPPAFRELPHRIDHERYSSRRSRTFGNPLQAVDHLDRMFRHSGANHKRETIAFSKRRQNAMERAAVTITWMNFVKRRQEKDLDSPTPAQELGLTDHALGVAEILNRRLFVSLVPLPGPMKDVYWRRIPTRQIPNGRRHALHHAA